MEGSHGGMLGTRSAYLSSGVRTRGQRRLHYATRRASLVRRRASMHIRTVIEPSDADKKRLSGSPTVDSISR